MVVILGSTERKGCKWRINGDDLHPGWGSGFKVQHFIQFGGFNPENVSQIGSFQPKSLWGEKKKYVKPPPVVWFLLSCFFGRVQKSPPPKKTNISSPPLFRLKSIKCSVFFQLTYAKNWNDKLESRSVDYSQQPYQCILTHWESFRICLFFSQKKVMELCLEPTLSPLQVQYIPVILSSMNCQWGPRLYVTTFRSLKMSSKIEHLDAPPLSWCYCDYSHVIIRKLVDADPRDLLWWRLNVPQSWIFEVTFQWPCR